MSNLQQHTNAPPGSRGVNRTRVIAVGLAVWSFAFACVHGAWALGWRWGVPASAPPIAERPWFLVYDVIAGLLILGAALVCVGFYRGRGTRRLRQLTVAGSVVALLRGVPALIIDVSTHTYSGVSFGADIWFTVAGVAGLALASAATPRP